MKAARLEALLAGLWAGLLLAVALIATPAPFATLAPADAGRVVARVLEREAQASLVVAVLLLVLARRREGAAGPDDGRTRVSAEVLLLLGTLACTIVGWFVVQPLMPAARAGQGALSFAALHALSLGCFVLKGALVLVLAWRLGGRSAGANRVAGSVGVSPVAPTS